MLGSHGKYGFCSEPLAEHLPVLHAGWYLGAGRQESHRGAQHGSHFGGQGEHGSHFGGHFTSQGEQKQSHQLRLQLAKQNTLIKKRAAKAVRKG